MTDIPHTVLADVPFGFDNKATRAAAVDQYKVMTLEQIKAYRFPHDETSCLLLSWCPNTAMREGLAIVEAWGFTYKGLITWIKPHMGIGNYARNASEQLILATKGRVKVKAHNVLTWFIADSLGHSRKPEQQYDIAERLGQPAYLELFARRKRAGWQQIGDELK
jgi:N6-adenosine-specific RNA methylase IME4